MRYGSRFRLWLALSGGVLLLVVFGVVVFLFYESPANPARKTVLLSLFLITLVFTLLGELLLLRWFMRPYRQLVGEAERATSFTGPKSSHDEAEFVLQTFQSVVAKLKSQTTELESLNAQVSERAASAEMLSQRIVASVPSGLITFDASGRVTMINAPASELLASDMNGEISLGALRSHAPELAEMIANCLSKGEIYRRAEVITINSNHQEKRLGVTVAPLDSATNTSGREALCLMSDLTEITNLREQLALKKNLENLGEMSAGLAHEFKNALATLHGYAQLLQTLSQDEKSQTAATAMLQEVRNLTEMVTSFLRFARPEELEMNYVSLSDIVLACAEELTPLLKEREVALLLDEDYPTVKADERMMRQALLNLIRNAIEAIDDEQTLRVVSVMCSQEKEPGGKRWILLEIKDTGRGIPPQDLHKIFLPFFTTKTKGHGIGLALTHRVVTEHGGTLTAANAKDGGAVFTIYLPLN
jgi:nitrogen fixation/metabolism regulation signal transduction histidine kinase